MAVVTIMIMAASCSKGSCQKEALAYLKDTISLQWKDPKSFHFDNPEIMRETDSTFLAKVKIYGNNSYGNEICHDYMFLYKTQKHPLYGPASGGTVVQLNSDEDYDKKLLNRLREAYQKDEELKSINANAADTTSLMDSEITSHLSIFLGLKESFKKDSAPF